MIRHLRQAFNHNYTDAAYQHLLADLNRITRTELSIRVAETPVFLPQTMLQQMIDAGAAMTHQLVSDTEYLQQAAATIPPAFRVANQSARPHFMTVDFGLVHTGDGSWQGDPATLEPRLVELQAFPSVFGLQSLLGQLYCKHFNLSGSVAQYPNDLDETTYWQLLRQTIVADHDPANVVLLEVSPDQQKTLPDFHIHEDRLGIATVDIAHVRQRGRHLFYERDGVETPIRRIYNRSIADEMVRKSIQPGFDLTADLDVEWAGHPNWYFLISKFALPYLRHPFVPPAVFLSDFLNGRSRDRLSADRSQWVFKPLFSFAGKGIEFGPSDETLAAVPAAERANYLLQQRVAFTPTVDTPFGMTQVEVRIMYVWPDGGDLQAIQTLTRLGRGAMMGVDHNRNQQWVGGSAGLIA
ncbi:hypothetical protein [Terriglobus aquaticus]|uniref:Circularly permuted type 2 ATP-grasp protein n=1 Tax=Terriglobus aquaticus TaxID=940139 RepID=A0ABW9KMT1_9BACT|nr:hypothetical protein [Terriglobus aquaticus]